VTAIPAARDPRSFPRWERVLEWQVKKILKNMVLCFAWYYICIRFVKKFNAMNLENTQAQMRKGVLEFCILSILSGREAYASELIQTLKDSKLLVVEGTIYPLLTRLKNDGLLTYRWEESTSGPPRKYYLITPLGQEFLEALRKTWNDLAEAVRKTTK
jgi:PadR family transcriptional regulator, regulatory protein PadR